jgi:histidyl-tRNA synthetase
MKKADASGARVALIVGEDELRAGQVSLKPLRRQAEQIRVSRAEAPHALKEMLRKEAD